MLKVLKERQDVFLAREELRRLNISFVETPLARWLKKVGLKQGISIGDQIKSWDLLETIEFLQRNLSHQGSILDIGCYACEVLPILHKLGFNSLTGLDLDERVSRMPSGDKIRYLVGDFMATEFSDSSFDCVTAISVIEHGLNPRKLFSELSRILRPRGIFVASFDYWPQKLSTDNKKLFGMSWDILSSEDVESLLREAATFGLRPVGPIDFGAQEAPVRFGGHAYTFGWLALSKQ